MIGLLGFEGAWFFFNFFFTYSILHVLRCGFCFLDSSCCPDTTIRLVLLFFFSLPLWVGDNGAGVRIGS